MHLPLRFSRTFKRNFTLFQTFLKTDYRIRPHSRLILLLISSVESTIVVYTFSLKSPRRKSHKELSLVKELATQKVHLYQSTSEASYCPNVFSRDENNLLKQHPDEKCSHFVKMQIEETHSLRACFSILPRSHFRFQQNRAYNLAFWNFAPSD